MAIEWFLVFFTLFVCLAAGTFAGTALAAWFGKGEKIQMPGLVTAFVALVAGGITSFLHLKTPARFFGQFGNVESPINHELIAVIVMGIVMAVYFFQLRNKKMPSKIVSAISAIVSLLVVIVVSISYLLAARPAWDTFLLPVYYIVNAALLGAFVLFIIAKATGEDELLSGAYAKSALVSLGVSVLVLAGYMAHITSTAGTVYSQVYHSDLMRVPPISPDIMATRLLSGDLAAIFWGLVVVIGIAIPAAVLFLRRNAKTQNTAIVLAGGALVALVVGGVAFRALLYIIGSAVFIY